MEITRQNPSARFTVPDKITVRQQLAYFSASVAPDRAMLERYWLAAIPLINDWQCGILPDINTDLDSITDPHATQVIIWAGLEVKKHIDMLGEVSKN